MSEAARRIASLSPAQRELLLRRLRERRPPGAHVQPALPELVPRPEQRHLPFPLTDVQQAYWIGRSGLFDLSQVGSNGYFELHFELFDDGDVDRFEAALDHVVRRHDMLRAVVGPDAMQRVLPEVPRLRLPVFDLRRSPSAAAEERLSAARRRLQEKRADVDRWPTFDIELYRLAEGARLLARFELLFLDGETRLVVFRDLFRHMASPADEPAPVGCTYRDIAESWRGFRASPAFARHREYWQRRLATLPPAVELPLAVPVSPRVPSRWRVRSERLLEPEPWRLLKERAGALRLTPSQLVTAAFLDVLARWSPQRRFSLVLESTFNPLLHPAVPEVVGNFNSTTLVSVEHWPETFEERALALREQLAEALEHAAFSGFLVVRELNRRQGESSAVAQPVVFNSLLEMTSRGPDVGPMPLPYRYVDAGMYPPQLLLVNTVAEFGGALFSRWKAIEDVLPPELVPELADSYRRLLRRLAEDPAAWRTPWAEGARRLLPPAQAAARRAIAAELPSSSPWELACRGLAGDPRRQAVAGVGGTLAAGELLARSTALAAALRRAGVGPGQAVGLAVPKGAPWVIGALGIAGAGAALLSLCGPTAAGRLRAHLASGGELAALVVPPGADAAAPPWPDLDLPRLALDESPPPADGELPPPEPAAAAWVAPRKTPAAAAMMSHAALAAAVAAVVERCGLTSGDRVAWGSPADAELSLVAVFATLSAGATLTVAGAAADFPAGAATVWAGGGADAEALAGGGTRGLRLVLVGADRMPAPLVAGLRRHQPELAVAWLTGPPELCGAAAMALAAPGEPVPAPLVALPGLWIRAVDEDLQACPDWVVGRAAYGGPALSAPPAPGDQGFGRCPVTGEPLLCTGELARHRPDRGIEMLGPAPRAAFSVAGHRLLAREIEEDLETFPGVRRAVVAPADGPARRRAVALVLAAPELDAATLEERLREWPAWRVPRTVLLLDRLPADEAGGVDEGRLPPPPPPPRGADSPQRLALESSIAGLWAEVLERPAPIDTDRGFYDLGGDSLRLARLAERLHRRFGSDLPLERFFLDPTVGGLAQLLLGPPAAVVVEARLPRPNRSPREDTT